MWTQKTFSLKSFFSEVKPTYKSTLGRGMGLGPEELTSDRREGCQGPKEWLEKSLNSQDARDHPMGEFGGLGGAMI